MQAKWKVKILNGLMFAHLGFLRLLVRCIPAEVPSSCGRLWRPHHCRGRGQVTLVLTAGMFHHRRQFIHGVTMLSRMLSSRAHYFRFRGMMSQFQSGIEMNSLTSASLRIEGQRCSFKAHRRGCFKTKRNVNILRWRCNLRNWRRRNSFDVHICRTSRPWTDSRWPGCSADIRVKQVENLGGRGFNRLCQKIGRFNHVEMSGCRGSQADFGSGRAGRRCYHFPSTLALHREFTATTFEATCRRYSIDIQGHCNKKQVPIKI